jgi:hypothetical protein
MDYQKAQDAKRIAAKFQELARLRGGDNQSLLALLVKHLPGASEGRTSGWSTAEVLAACEKALREPSA